MRVSISSKRGLAFAAASLIGITSLAAPAFADEAIIGFDSKTHDVGVVVISCDNTEVAYKPVINPTVGAADQLTATNADDNAFLLSTLQRGEQPGSRLALLASTSKVAKADQNVIYLDGEIGAGGINHGRASELLFKGEKAKFASHSSGTAAAQDAAMAAFKKANGSLANKLLVAAAALQAHSNLGTCGAKSTSAALLVAYRNDPVYNAMSSFAPSKDATHAVSAGDAAAPSVFASVLLKSDAKTSALAELASRVGTLATGDSKKVQYNVYAEEAKATKLMWLSIIGAVVAAAAIIFLVRRQRRLNSAAPNAKPKNAKKPKK